MPKAIPAPVSGALGAVRGLVQAWLLDPVKNYRHRSIIPLDGGSSATLAGTTAIFFGIGLTMFLLPPVPGVPVYFAGGIILTKAAEREMGFSAALIFTIFVCYLIKLTAIVMQQKGIGERMGSSVRVKSFVGVNSPSSRPSSSS